MSKDPAFLFYPGDWLGGTMYMTHEEKGAYMDLLVLQFNNGPFSEAQAKQVLSICFASVWQVVKQKFEFKDGKYSNHRLSLEVERRQKFTESRRNNALSKKTNKASAKHMHKHMHKHMENENENENNLNIRCANFEKEVLAIGSAQYHEVNLNEFISYWTEPNKSKTKMRFELEKTWDTKRRLATWMSRVKDFKKGEPKAEVYKGKFLTDEEADKKYGKIDYEALKERTSQTQRIADVAKGH